MLVQEIINLATEGDSLVVVLLRKCMVLGHKLRNQALVDWATHELQGYKPEETLPDYRIVHVGAKGTLVGPFGAQINNYPIPASLLEKPHREAATTVKLREPIASYEELMRSKSTSFRMEWPSDLALYYQNKVVTQNGCHLIHAWQDVSRSRFAQIFDAVKNRTLGMALELQSSMGSEEALENISPQVAAKIEKTVTNNIYGGINVIASGESNVTSSVSHSQNTIEAGDMASLARALHEGGLPSEDIQGLSAAIEQDSPVNFGSKTKQWIKSAGKKLLVGGVSVGSTVAEGVITEHLKHYFGLKP